MKKQIKATNKTWKRLKPFEEFSFFDDVSWPFSSPGVFFLWRNPSPALFSRDNLMTTSLCKSLFVSPNSLFNISRSAVRFTVKATKSSYFFRRLVTSVYIASGLSIDDIVGGVAPAATWALTFCLFASHCEVLLVARAGASFPDFSAPKVVSFTAGLVNRTFKRLPVMAFLSTEDQRLIIFSLFFFWRFVSPSLE